MEYSSDTAEQLESGRIGKAGVRAESAITPLPGAAFLAFPGMAELLRAELAGRFGFHSAPAADYGELLYFPNFPTAAPDAQSAGTSGALPYWAKSAMLSPKKISFPSIGSGAAALRAIQRSWAPYSYRHFRRTALIQEKLPYVNTKVRRFPAEIPTSPIGLYTLLDKTTMLASESTGRILPAGHIAFEEDHEHPPSRAYLKLQEGLALAAALDGAEIPHAGHRCFEAGACPGGWTWVLTNLGAQVVAVDRTELDPVLMRSPLVTFLRHDAFTLTPREIGLCDWVFSDVICYPERLYAWARGWIESGLAKNMLCTIKMQGAPNWDVVRRFAEIPGSRIVHLNYNKHELTWLRTERRAAT